MPWEGGAQIVPEEPTGDKVGQPYPVEQRVVRPGRIGEAAVALGRRRERVLGDVLGDVDRHREVEGDPLAASAESIVRQVLYGSHYFRREFGRTSAEYMLPDSFGFPASLPSILAHMGLKGFSTQKLYWKSAARVGGPDSIERTPDGVPFNVGVWEGPDGRGIVSALNPRPYDSNVREDYSKSPPPTAASGDALRIDGDPEVPDCRPSPMHGRC